MNSNVIHLHRAGSYVSAPPPAPAPAVAEDSDGGWMISFVDILMLLLTLFVVLLAVSRNPKPEAHTTTTAPAVTAHKVTPAPKVQKPAPVAAATAAAPRKPTPVATEVQHNAVIKPVLPEIAAAPTAKPQPAPKTPETATTEPAPKVVSAPVPAKSAAPPRPALTVPEDLKQQVEITPTATAVNLVIKDDVLFDTGSAELKPAGQALLARVAKLFDDNGYPISVEGHTDDTPIHTARFPSNWELSTARATNVTRFLISQGVAAKRLSAVGYADTRPRADNGNAKGRAANRRVSLVVHVKKAPGQSSWEKSRSPGKGSSGSAHPEIVSAP